MADAIRRTSQGETPQVGAVRVAPALATVRLGPARLPFSPSTHTCTQASCPSVPSHRQAREALDHLKDPAIQQERERHMEALSDAQVRCRQYNVAMVPAWHRTPGPFATGVMAWAGTTLLCGLPATRSSEQSYDAQRFGGCRAAGGWRRVM